MKQHRNRKTPARARSVGRKAMAVTLAIGVAVITPGTAQELTAEQLQQAQFLEDIGASQRIDFSGKLRMLSQRIPAAACNYAEGITPDSSGAMLDTASAEFQQIVNALEFGDESLGIVGAEERRKTLIGLRKLRENWDPMFATADAIHNGENSTEAVTTIADQSVPVLDIAKLLVSTISEEYSNPVALLQADALVIDIAGRQRMLSQRMSKNVCLIAAGVNVDTAMSELASTAQLFENALIALQNGMPDAGVKAPPNAEIQEGLDVVMDDWNGLKPIVTRVLAGETLDDETRGIMFNGANHMTADMNKVVGMYSEASKLGL